MASSITIKAMVIVELLLGSRICSLLSYHRSLEGSLVSLCLLTLLTLYRISLVSISCTLGLQKTLYMTSRLNYLNIILRQVALLFIDSLNVCNTVVNAADYIYTRSGQFLSLWCQPCYWSAPSVMIIMLPKLRSLQWVVSTLVPL